MVCINAISSYIAHIFSSSSRESVSSHLANYSLSILMRL
jgi:hypothetical protein